MKKLPKFLIAEDASKGDDTFVIHMESPVIIAQVFHFGLDQEVERQKCSSNFQTSATLNYPHELICLGSVFCGPTDLSNDELSNIMTDMGKWYWDYLVWEDSEMNL